MNRAAIARAAVISALTAGLVYGVQQTDVSADWSRSGDDSAARSASASLSTTLVCPGPDRPGTTGYESANQQVSLAQASAPRTLIKAPVAGGTVSSARMPGSAGAAPAPLSAADTARQTEITGAGAVELTGQGGAATGIAALQYGTDDLPTVAGLAMVPCTQPTSSTWIPLGGNAAGRVGRIVLSNPSGVPVTVDADVLGRNGVAADKGANGVVVAPGQRTVVTLGSFDADLADAFVHVTARGAAVGVAAFDVLMEGETRGGQAGVSGTTPAENQVFAALPVATKDPTVRIAVPGSQDASVRVRAVDPTGLVVADEVGEIKAGRSGSITLPDVPAGTYAVHVSADQPVVAGGFARTAASGTTDIAWANASEPITALAGTPVPTQPAQISSAISVFAPDKPAVVDVVTTGPNARTQRVSLAAETGRQITITGAASVWVRVVSGSVHASLVSKGGAPSKPLLDVVGLPAVPVEATVRDTAAERD